MINDPNQFSKAFFLQGLQSWSFWKWRHGDKESLYSQLLPRHFGRWPPKSFLASARKCFFEARKLSTKIPGFWNWSKMVTPKNMNKKNTWLHDSPLPLDDTLPSSGKPGDHRPWKSDFQEFQSPLAWHTEEECWERVRLSGNLQEIWYEKIQQLEWLELFGGVKCWVWHCEDPSNSGSNESFYSLWSRFFQHLKTQFSPGSIFSGCGEDSYFDATIFSEISLGGSTTIEKRIFGTTSKEIQHPRDSGPEMIVKNGGWCTKNLPK